MRLTAYYQRDRVRYILCQISVEEMSGVLHDLKTAGVHGVPQYFDALRRLWPVPAHGSPCVRFKHERLRKRR